MPENIPIPSGYDVYWEKWTDVYNPEIEEIEASSQFSEEKEPEDLSFEEEFESDFKKIKNIPTIFTPFGVLPLTEQSLASTYFKFWVGHTNFRITPAFYRIISDVSGVESIDVFSPYRFRIGIARLFKDRIVMSQIRKNTVGYIKEIQDASSHQSDNSGSS